LKDFFLFPWLVFLDPIGHNVFLTLLLK